MKNKKVSVRTITIILIGIIIALISIILNSKNLNIEKQAGTSKEQLEEETTDNSYVEITTHLSEISEQEEKLLTFKSVIAGAITEMGVETSEDADATTMANNIKSLLEASSADIEPAEEGYCHINPNNNGTGYSRSESLTVSKDYDKAMLLVCTGIDNSTTQDTTISVDNGVVESTIRTSSPAYFSHSEAIACFVSNVKAGTMTVTCTNYHSISSTTNYTVKLVGLS